VEIVYLFTVHSLVLSCHPESRWRILDDISILSDHSLRSRWQTV